MAHKALNSQAESWAHLKPNKHCKVTSLLVPCWVNAAGAYHRVDENGIQDGPSYTNQDGYQAWCLNGKYHRVDGPACVSPKYPSSSEYYLDGHYLTQEQWARDPRVIEFHSRTPQEAEAWLTRL